MKEHSTRHVIDQIEWQDFHDRFISLANEQARIVHGTREDFLFADCEFFDFDFFSISKGPCCLLPSLESAVILDLRRGPDEHLKAQVVSLATKAAIALGCPHDVPPLKFWLYRLFLHLQKAKSPHLFAPISETQIGDNPMEDLLKPLAGKTICTPGGIIKDVCSASANFCLWLDQRTLEVALLERHQLSLKDGGGQAIFCHSSDYRSIKFNGVPYTLTTQQAQIVQRLYDAYESGLRDVGKEDIFDLLGGLEKSKHSRVRDSFKLRNRSLWGTLIVEGASRGTYRLNIFPKESQKTALQ